MAQFTLKIKTYDPDIVNAFARLRKSRKQSAYTHEALKYFLASEQGMQVMDLMSRETPPTRTKPQIATEQPREMLPKPAAVVERHIIPSGEVTDDYCSSVLGKILE
ncbi:hypothetical protein [Geomobilimonas luticola]|uniref:Uncharacterized protein n=1 Tax=Geomobilimonas luticola TaxID=1114878 RepID=A0ABS5SB87_9BACT|nr:hypothetical protein [Geomobilimonas luticola]MBT0652644.1 hypothetical protein [Geomobilimonas luticola]